MAFDEDMSEEEYKKCRDAFEISMGVSLYNNNPPIKEWLEWKKAWAASIQKESKT